MPPPPPRYSTDAPPRLSERPGSGASGSVGSGVTVGAPPTLPERASGGVGSGVTVGERGAEGAEGKECSDSDSDSSEGGDSSEDSSSENDSTIEEEKEDEPQTGPGVLRIVGPDVPKLTHKRLASRDFAIDNSQDNSPAHSRVHNSQNNSNPGLLMVNRRASMYDLNRDDSASVMPSFTTNLNSVVYNSDSLSEDQDDQPFLERGSFNMLGIVTSDD